MKRHGISAWTVGALSLIVILIMCSVSFADSKIERNYDVELYVENEIGVPTFIKGNLVAGIDNGQEDRATFQFLADNATSFKMNDPAAELRAVRLDVDNLGMRHLRLQQYYNDIRVVGGVLISHISVDGVLTGINGHYEAGIETDVTPVIMSSQALDIARADLEEHFGTGDPDTPELVIFPWYGEGEEKFEYYLCWRFFLYSDTPMGRWEYLVDAKTGEFVFRANRIMDANDIGTGYGVMGGFRDHIDTDWTGSTYRMVDFTRQLNNNPHGHDGEMPDGNYIQTNIAGSTLPGSVATDTDNDWSASSQAPAVDGHYYSAAVYDWMLDSLDRNGYNGSGASMLTIVNYSGEGDNNAYWDGSRIVVWSWSSGWRSLAGCPDVIAHEWGHAVTENCSDLVYQLEPGALNESYSDMMGAAFEFTSDDPGDWYMGENGEIGGNGFRNMENPHEFGDPDYYGTSDPYWVDVVGCTPSWLNDYCGVHTNSGVGNKWFSLLSDGGTHHSQTVVGIGVNHAIEIAYRANAFYWTSNTDYHDAALGTISAADDLDPSGTWTQQVRNAWIAVGVSVPNPSISFTYPDGIPDIVIATQDTTFSVIISGSAGGSPVSGSGQIHYSIDGAPYTTVYMTETTPNNYLATLPGIDCGSTLEYYFSGDELSTGTKTDPEGAPAIVYSALPVTSASTVFQDNFQTNQGWSVSGNATDGQWSRGVPVGGGDRGDPPTDFDGSGACYLTDNVDGNSDVDGGTTTLTSPNIDCSAGDALIHYARWFSNDTGDSPNEDVFVVYVSSDGGANWTEVETVGPVAEASGGWYEHSFFLTDFVTPSAQVKVRFDASDLINGSIVEAAVDDFEVTVFECEAMVDSDGDGWYDFEDNCVDVYNPGQEDADGDGVGDLCDVCTDTDDDGFGDPGYPENTCELDNCPAVYNPGQADADSDGIGDDCDECTDTDGDGFGNPGYAANTCDDDNCPSVYNPGQEDADGDGIGDSCDVCTDLDGDGYGDPGYPANTCELDNCPTIANQFQRDEDGDGIGDVCDDCTDTDGDGYGNPGFTANTCPDDNCPNLYNPAQEDADFDGIGDSCDVCTDTDDDGFGDPGFPANTCDTDNCPAVSNPGQEDADTDGAGDLCDDCTDTDDDGYGDPGYPANTCADDNCPGVSNPDQEDSDSDGAGDLCDECPDDSNDVCCNPQFSNNPPQVLPPFDVTVEPGDTVDYQITYDDPDCDGSDLALDLFGLPSWCTLDGITVSGAVECSYSDTSFTVVVDDGTLADTAVITIHVDHSNVAPVIEPESDHVIRSGLQFTYSPVVTDPDDVDHIIEYIEYPSWCTIVGMDLEGIVPELLSNETVTLIASDFCSSDTMSFDITSYVCGDANQSDNVDIDDAVYLVQFIFSGGPLPFPWEAGDANCSGDLDIDDVVYLVTYIFSAGPAPCDGC